MSDEEVWRCHVLWALRMKVDKQTVDKADNEQSE